MWLSCHCFIGFRWCWCQKLVWEDSSLQDFQKPYVIVIKWWSNRLSKPLGQQVNPWSTRLNLNQSMPTLVNWLVNGQSLTDHSQRSITIFEACEQVEAHERVFLTHRGIWKSFMTYSSAYGSLTSMHALFQCVEAYPMSTQGEKACKIVFWHVTAHKILFLAY